jgi:iron complex transport system substrate-binding protein
MRIVTLPPGATDLVRALGLGAQIVGGLGAGDAQPAQVAREVDPPRPDTPLLAGVTPHSHLTRYLLDPVALGAAGPEVILTEEVCPVCRAAYTPLADGAGVGRGALGSGRAAQVQVISFTPRRLEDALAPIAPVGALLGQAQRGQALSRARGARLLALSMHVARHLVRSGGTRPTVALLRTDGERVVAPGYWYPDLVDAAGGVPLLAQAGGEDVPLTPAEVGAASPGLVVLGADTLVRAEAALAGLRPEIGAVPAWALRLDGLFTHAGPGLVEAVETLLRIISPAALGANGTPPPPDRAFPVPVAEG